jgi:hypothetical protein
VARLRQPEADTEGALFGGLEHASMAQRGMFLSSVKFDAFRRYCRCTMPDQCPLSAL